MKLEIEFRCSDCFQKHKEEVQKGNYMTEHSWLLLSEAVLHCKENPLHSVSAETEISI